MTGFEYARLQGVLNFSLADFRGLQIQYAFGDTVTVPVVLWLMKAAILPALRISSSMEATDEAM
jgi:hypothetical protein